MSLRALLEEPSVAALPGIAIEMLGGYALRASLQQKAKEQADDPQRRRALTATVLSADRIGQL